MGRISLRNLANLCYRLGTSLRAGVDVLRVLQQESAQGNSTFRSHMSEIARRVSGGSTLAEAVRACHGYFPPLTCELVDVGEQTGRLDEVLLRLADHYQHIRAVRRSFLTTIAWPAMQLTLALFILGLLILVLGVIDPSSKGVFGLAGPRGLLIFTLIVTFCLTALGLGVWGLLRGWFGTVPTAVMMRIPGVGHSIKTMALARVAWTLSLALEAGIDACRSIRMALDSTQNRYYTQHNNAVEAAVMRGVQYHEALRPTNAFPNDFLVSLSNAEETGTETESLSRLSQQLQERAEAASKALALIASFVIWGAILALIAFVVIYLVVTLYLNPYMDLINDLM
ncbi:MAG: hypothetical protein FJ276_04570 [Planctomycetes bacterium]|nr:hypothetical protein [Planctomycetota bacterium]